MNQSVAIFDQRSHLYDEEIGKKKSNSFIDSWDCRLHIGPVPQIFGPQMQSACSDNEEDEGGSEADELEEEEGEETKEDEEEEVVDDDEEGGRAMVPALPSFLRLLQRRCHA